MLPSVSLTPCLFNLCPFIPRFICILHVQNLFPIGPAVWPHFPVFWIVDPIKPPKMPPWGIVGRIVFSLCPFPDESTDVYQIWCQSVQPFDSFPRLLNLWPPNLPPCPLGYWGATCIYMPIPRWIRRREPKLVPIGLADSFPWLLNVWPPKTP